jgi:hypothetical protein
MSSILNSVESKKKENFSKSCHGLAEWIVDIEFRTAEVLSKLNEKRKKGVVRISEVNVWLNSSDPMHMAHARYFFRE